MRELLKISDKLKPTISCVWYESPCFSVRYNKREQKFTGIIIGTHKCDFEQDTHLIEMYSLYRISVRDEEFSDFLLEHRDVNKWTEEFLLYMMIKFEIERK